MSLRFNRFHKCFNFSKGSNNFLPVSRKTCVNVWHEYFSLFYYHYYFFSNIFHSLHFPVLFRPKTIWHISRLGLFSPKLCLLTRKKFRDWYFQVRIVIETLSSDKLFFFSIFNSICSIFRLFFLKSRKLEYSLFFSLYWSIYLLLIPDPISITYSIRLTPTSEISSHLSGR